jgi:hypothetical protein
MFCGSETRLMRIVPQYLADALAGSNSAATTLAATRPSD